MNTSNYPTATVNATAKKKFFDSRPNIYSEIDNMIRNNQISTPKILYMMYVRGEWVFTTIEHHTPNIIHIHISGHDHFHMDEMVSVDFSRVHWLYVYGHKPDYQDRMYLTTALFLHFGVQLEFLSGSAAPTIPAEESEMLTA